jgi:hypothetical protein
MDMQALRQYADAHAQAVVAGDFEAAARDCTEQVKAGMPGLVPLLPQPVTSAEVVRVEQQGDGAVVEIAYRGSDKELTLRSEWHDQGARPLITAAAVV